MWKIDVNHMSERSLLKNMYLTQAIVFAVACLLLWWQDRFSLSLWSVSSWRVIVYGLLVGLFILFADLVLTFAFPRLMTDDGGVNEKLFRRRPLWHIFVITAVVAFCEELLFRGAVQPLIGIFGTSVLFALIHYRYLRRWMMVSFLFLISLLFGIATELTGTLVAATIAHFTVDFLLGVLMRVGLFDRVLEQK